jgi:hypothetical protein
VENKSTAKARAGAKHISSFIKKNNLLFYKLLFLDMIFKKNCKYNFFNFLIRANIAPRQLHDPCPNCLIFLSISAPIMTNNIILVIKLGKRHILIMTVYIY